MPSVARFLALAVAALSIGCAEIGDGEMLEAEVIEEGTEDANEPPLERPPKTNGIVVSQSQGAIATDANVNCRYTESGNHSDSRHFRVFSGADLPDGGRIVEVRLAIEVAESPQGSQPATLRLHQLLGTNFGLFALETLDEIPLSISDQGMSEISIPVDGVVVPSSTFVVEVDIPDSGDARNLRLGHNLEPQTGATYLVSDACGFAEPTDIATLDNPEKPGETFAENSWLVSLVVEPN